MKIRILLILVFGFAQCFVIADGDAPAENESTSVSEKNETVKLPLESVKSWDEMSPQERKKWALEMRREELMVARAKPDPTEIVCLKQKARIGSRIKRTVCKSRAEIRREQERSYDEIMASMRVDGRRRLALPKRSRLPGRSSITRSSGRPDK